MIIRSNAFMKQLFYVAASTLFSSMIFSSCQKVSSSSSVTGDWARSSEFEGVVRTEAVGFTINNVQYIGGGYNGNNRMNDFWKLDESSGTWIRVADFPGTARNSAVAFSINGKGYVGTGYDGTNMLKDFWEYDPAADKWTEKADFGGTARYGAVGFSINGEGYIATGFDSTYRKDLWQYDPGTDTWAQKASLGGDKRSDAAAFVYDNLAYVVTGINNGSYLDDMWAYNPATDSWSERRKIINTADSTYDDNYGNNITRSNAAVFMINDTAYLSGGSYNGIIGSTWAFDVKQDLWFQKTGFEGSARQGAIGFTVNNHGYVVTGDNGSNYFDDLWEFFPDATQTNDDN